MRVTTNNPAYERRDRRHQANSASAEREWPVQVAAPPLIKGPFTMGGDPTLVEYEIVARLLLPAADTEVIPLISFCCSPEDGAYVEVQWTTRDRRTPTGIWERSTTVAVPRQFAITVDKGKRAAREIDVAA